MDEAAFHDQFFQAEAERIFSSRLYRLLLDLHVRFLLDVTPELAEARVLSIGCGDGRRELAMARCARHIVGIDVSRVAVANARQRARDLGVSNVEFHVDTAERLVENLESPFDAVWCPGVLHHLSDGDIGALLRAAAAALRPGGRFVSMDPNAYRAVNVFKPIVRRAYDRYHSAGERELRPRDVAAKLERAGFRDIEIRFTDCFISPLAWLFPRLTGPVAPFLVAVDQLLVRTPCIRQLSSGFAAIARTGPA